MDHLPYRLVWKAHDGADGLFSASSVWESIRDRANIVHWKDVVWLSLPCFPCVASYASEIKNSGEASSLGCFCKSPEYFVFFVRYNHIPITISSLKADFQDKWGQVCAGLLEFLGTFLVGLILLLF